MGYRCTDVIGNKSRMNRLHRNLHIAVPDVFTARASMLGVLRVVILSVCPSVTRVSSTPPSLFTPITVRWALAIGYAYSRLLLLRSRYV